MHSTSTPSTHTPLTPSLPQPPLKISTLPVTQDVSARPAPVRIINSQGLDDKRNDLKARPRRAPKNHNLATSTTAPTPHLPSHITSNGSRTSLPHCLLAWLVHPHARNHPFLALRNDGLGHGSSSAFSNSKIDYTSAVTGRDTDSFQRL